MDRRGKKAFAYYTLKYRDGRGKHTAKFLLASSAMGAYAKLQENPAVQSAAWFSAGGQCFASFTRSGAQGVLPL